MDRQAYAASIERLEPAPREVRCRDKKIWGLRVLFLPLVGVALVFIYQVLISVLWVMFGYDVQGQIVAASEVRSKTTAHYVIYRYIERGQQYSRETSVESGFYESLPAGLKEPLKASDAYVPATVRILSLGSVHEVDIVPWPDRPLRTIAAALARGCLEIGIVLCLLWPIWMVPWRHRRLVRDGVVAQGEITEVVLKARQQRVNYTFTCANGRVIRKRQFVLFGKERITTGPAIIFYNRDRPRSSVILAGSAYEPVQM
jgi:hypothetical protein